MPLLVPTDFQGKKLCPFSASHQDNSTLAVSDGRYVSIRAHTIGAAAPSTPQLLSPLANILSTQQQQQQLSRQQQGCSRPHPPAIQQLAFNAPTTVAKHQQAQSRCADPHQDDDDDDHRSLEFRNNEASLLAVVAGSSVAVYHVAAPSTEGKHSSSTTSTTTTGSGGGNGTPSGGDTAHSSGHNNNCDVGSGSNGHSGARPPALAGVLLTSGGAKIRALAWHPACPHIFAAATQAVPSAICTADHLRGEDCVEELLIVSCQPDAPPIPLPSTLSSPAAASTHPASAAASLSSMACGSVAHHQTPPFPLGAGKVLPSPSSSPAAAAAPAAATASQQAVPRGNSSCQVLARLEPSTPQPSPTLCMTWVERGLGPSASGTMSFKVWRDNPKPPVVVIGRLCRMAGGCLFMARLGQP
eukprot:1158900-Pelagomonas_calceolata.AAC.7